MEAETTIGREVERLLRVRRRLNAEAERLSEEYGWLRQQGTRLHQQLRHSLSQSQSAQLVQLGRQFMEVYRRLEVESEQFHTACECYVRDTQRLQQALKPLLTVGEPFQLAS